LRNASSLKADKNCVANSGPKRGETSSPIALSRLRFTCGTSGMALVWHISSRDARL
jgi:hypothetical protein